MKVHIQELSYRLHGEKGKSMMPTIGYDKAKDWMVNGCKVIEVQQLRGGHRPLITDPEGVQQAYIRQDSWKKLRKECKPIGLIATGRRKQQFHITWCIKEGGK